MESVEERCIKARQERIAREKARIDKLRELNLKKYNQIDAQSIVKTPSTLSLANKTLDSSNKPKNFLTNSKFTYPSLRREVKNNFSVNGVSKRPLTDPLKPAVEKKPVLLNGNIQKVAEVEKDSKMVTKSTVPPKNETKDFIKSNKIIPKFVNKQPMNAVKNVASKSLGPIKITSQFKLPENQ